MRNNLLIFPSSSTIDEDDDELELKMAAKFQSKISQPIISPSENSTVKHLNSALLSSAPPENHKRLSNSQVTGKDFDDAEKRREDEVTKQLDAYQVNVQHALQSSSGVSGHRTSSGKYMLSPLHQECPSTDIGIEDEGESEYEPKCIFVRVKAKVSGKYFLSFIFFYFLLISFLTQILSFFIRLSCTIMPCSQNLF
jgi:hypothetical protein